MGISYNKITLIGRLTRDPEIKQSNSGKPMAFFSIAVDRPGNNNETDFFRVSTIGKSAEFVGNNLFKGRLVLVEGSVVQNKFTNQQGIEKISVEVPFAHVVALETKAQADHMQQNNPSQQQGGYNPPRQNPQQRPPQQGYNNQPMQRQPQQRPQQNPGMSYNNSGGNSPL
jgi:single-strand DNA-binding protein